MKLCFVCETPFHLLNCMNIAFNMEKNKCKADLFIRITGGLNKKLINRLKNTNIFSNIYYYEYTDVDLKKGVLTYYHKLRRIIKCKTYITRMTTPAFCNYKENYKCIYIGYLSPFVYSLSLSFPKSSIAFFDDGLASYTDLVPQLGWIKRELLYMIRGCRSPWKFPRKIYVNNLSAVPNDSKDNYEQLTMFYKADKLFIDSLHYVFQYKHDTLYDQSNFIYLSQPHKQAGYIEKDREVIQTLKEYAGSFILRYHPSQIHSKMFYDMSVSQMVDTTNNMWELTVLEKISESSVLISEFSTAAVTPKLLFNKEPWIIFTYRLYKGDFEVDSIEEFIEHLKQIYKERKKIVVVNSIEELSNAVMTIGSLNKNNS